MHSVGSMIENMNKKHQVCSVIMARDHYKFDETCQTSILVLGIFVKPRLLISKSNGKVCSKGFRVGVT